jgi:hypothetical protein
MPPRRRPLRDPRPRCDSQPPAGDGEGSTHVETPADAEHRLDPAVQPAPEGAPGSDTAAGGRVPDGDPVGGNPADRGEHAGRVETPIQFGERRHPSVRRSADPDPAAAAPDPARFPHGQMSRDAERGPELSPDAEPPPEDRRGEDRVVEAELTAEAIDPLGLATRLAVRGAEHAQRRRHGDHETPPRRGWSPWPPGRERHGMPATPSALPSRRRVSPFDRRRRDAVAAGRREPPEPREARGHRGASQSSREGGPPTSARLKATLRFGARDRHRDHTPTARQLGRSRNPGPTVRRWIVPRRKASHACRAGWSTLSPPRSPQSAWDAAQRSRRRCRDSARGRDRGESRADARRCR